MRCRLRQTGQDMGLAAGIARLDAAGAGDMLLFDRVEGWCSRRDEHYEEWRLCFVPPVATGDVGYLRSLCVSGLRPAELRGIRVQGDGRTAYAQQSVFDDIGRASTAGEIVQAIFAADHRCDGIRLDAEAFAWPVPARMAQVRLQLRVAAVTQLSAIVVRGHLA